MRSLFLLLAAPSALSQTVDLTKKADAFDHFWKRCVGTGHMLLGTRADWQEHLRRAKDELGFTGIRGHGIFDDDMSVVPRVGQYEFFNVDTVYDYLLETGIKPVVELSFMPLALARCKPEDCQYSFGNHGAYKGLNMPPQNFTEWEELVGALASHFVDRYGLEEVSTWDFEVWNELWGMDFPHPYMDLYNSSARALKAVSPKLRVGGPATMQVLHVADFVDAVQAAKLPLDFVSTHLYPTDPECPDASDLDCFKRLIHEARDYVRQHTSVPFYITEYNAGLGLKEGLDLDAPFAAAFAFRQIAAIEDVDMFSWWTFTDIFEEQWMRSAPFHNGFGLQTVHGVPKPAWRAFQLLKDADAWRLPVEGTAPQSNASLSVMATVDKQEGAGSLQLFVAEWSPGKASRYSCDAASQSCKEDPRGSYTDEALCDAQCGGLQAADRTVTITIKHPEVGLFGAGDVTASLTRIDDKHANPKAAWEAMGRPSYPTRAQIQNMSAASELVEEAVEVTRVDAETSAVSFELPPWSAVRVLLKASGSSFVAI
jgi:xylan 1,4-beta-xylosidase